MNNNTPVSIYLDLMGLKMLKEAAPPFPLTKTA